MPPKKTTCAERSKKQESGSENGDATPASTRRSQRLTKKSSTTSIKDEPSSSKKPSPSKGKQSTTEKQIDDDLDKDSELKEEDEEYQLDSSSSDDFVKPTIPLKRGRPAPKLTSPSTITISKRLRAADPNIEIILPILSPSSSKDKGKARADPLPRFLLKQEEQDEQGESATPRQTHSRTISNGPDSTWNSSTATTSSTSSRTPSLYRTRSDASSSFADSSAADTPATSVFSEAKRGREGSLESLGYVSSLSEIKDIDSEEQKVVIDNSVHEEGSEELDSENSSSSSSESDVPVRTRNRRRVGGGSMTWFERVHKKLLNHHPELTTVWDDLNNVKQITPNPVEQPDGLKLPLLPFQKEGVGWMRKQEKVEEDEMGMGKTIQMISVLLTEPRQKPNLVIAPTVAILQWKAEIETHTDNLLTVLIFHGQNRTDSIKELKQYDVVLTTYAIVETGFRKQEQGFKRKGELIKEPSILHRIHWHRIVLDEAHNIKDRSSNTARAVFHLESDLKWSLSGTPLQNRVGELYSLIRFMQADPYAYYYCKNCKCKSLYWRFSDRRSCDDCGHKPMDHVCWWNNEILKPIQRYGTNGAGKTAFEKLHTLLDRMMLRRTKVERADDLGLPPRTVVIRRDLFNEEEEDMYDSLYSDSQRKFSTYVEQGTVLNNYANIFELLTKMRQCVDHPDLVLKKIKPSTVGAAGSGATTKQLVCGICQDRPEDAIISRCKHVFCRECCTQFLQSYSCEEDASATPDCPVCFAKLGVDLSQPTYELPEIVDGETGEIQHTGFARTSIVNRIDMSTWRSSTKIEALVEELSELRREDSTVKSIVFSQFVNFLDLVNWRLKRAGFECVKLDGSMSPQQRDATIKYFTTNPNVTVFLISLKAGGVALNLTEASKVFICDPWWNPAMDRIHRLGQHRPIKITRLIIENSIESRIVQLQDKKMALVESTIGKDSSALAKLSEDDLRFLFVL
ncbi:SNF2 family N-terminal domain-containing protein [Endogone sp. FLAS-F59071]|nr:SNF2 family N-terminal domain-containing protein [Endogone sp. FLAS-F59071]|eukprot:RUS22890.1 SNF2 family N-terminal domain-containing protein [Endogone sp. FLAS-F59071]